KPGSLETVHHILVFVQPPGGGGPEGALRRGEGGGPRGRDQAAGRGEGRRQGGGGGQRGGFGNRGGRGGGGGIGGRNLIAGYAPGANPLLSTDGATAMHVKAGSKLVFQLHYTPNGTPQKDRSYVGFRFADPKQVKHIARRTSVANMFFAIPPGDDNYQ